LNSSIAEAKVRLRASLRASGRAVAPDRANRSGRMIRSHLEAWADFARVSEVVAYAALGDEVDVSPVCELARDHRKPVLLPRIANEDLEFAAVDADEELLSGRLGIREPPASCPARRLADGAIVLVPGLAFDRAGGRLGRGAGYYDRALARIAASTARAIFVGIGFPAQVIERVPMARHDVKMHGILTEQALVWTEPQARMSGPTQ
jgi:5-formyltetrahydrofolate cyclo-ligase